MNYSDITMLGIMIITLFDSGFSLAALCSIYDPFRIQPDGNKYQIGGLFPLHDKDCVGLHEETVQDIIAIQWALTHWNQIPTNENLKTGLYAADTCSKPKEAISQAFKFLNLLGFHEPDGCNEKARKFPTLLGMFAPKDAKSAEAIATMLQEKIVPLLAYSFASADALAYMNVVHFATTAPTLTVFMNALVRFMKNVSSNLVAIVSTNSEEKLISRVLESLRQENIYVSELINPESSGFQQSIQNSDSQIMLTLMAPNKIKKLLYGKNFGADKTWIVMELDKEEWFSEKGQQEFLTDPDVQIIYLRQQKRDLPQFKNYFLRLLKNNYQSYFLLTSLMQQMYNCTILDDANDCSKVDTTTMALNYKQTTTVESIIRAVYALTAVAANLEKKPNILAKCAVLSTKCTKVIMTELESLVYEFGANDPAEFTGTTLHFYRESDTTLISNGIVIEGIEIIDDEQLGLIEVKVMEYETGMKPRFAMATPRRKKIYSVCAPHHPYCGRCDHIAQVDQKRFHLSNSRSYPLYIMGLFDFHGGRTCQTYRNSDISLPLVFLHTLATFPQRYPQISLLQNLEVGAILVDSCSSGRKAIETVVLSENHCFMVEQGGRNITIVPGSVFGYASALDGRVADALKSFFVSGDSLLISLDADHDRAFSAFSAVPSKKQEALALLKFLKKFSWEFISVVISDQEDISLSVYQQFEKLAAENGICIAETKVMNGQELSPSTITNVTVFFTSASDTATYFASKLRAESHHPHVHIVSGDAHDFYLHDPANIARFIGTISIQPKDVIYDDFRSWLEGITPLSLPEQWYWDYVEKRWQCALSEANRGIYENKVCTGDELMDVLSLGRMTKSGYFARGLERFLFALDAVYKQLCPEQVGVCSEFYNNGREQISKILRKAQIVDDFDIYEFVSNGKGSYHYQKIGNYSPKTAFKFVDPYKYFNAYGNHLSDSLSQAKVISQCILPFCKCMLNIKSMKLSYPVLEESEAGSYIRRVPTNGAFQQLQSPSILDRLTAGRWRLQTWKYALAAIITVMVIGAFGVLILAILKLYFRVIKGNQSLGLLLLIGVIILYITGYVFVFESTDIVCRLRIVLHPVGYAVCFGVMIVKAVQLKNAETLGFSDTVHIGYWNYWLLLLFIIGVQFALSSKWFTEEFASLVVLDDAEPRVVCNYGSDDFLSSQTYVIILQLLALFINSRNKNIKRNYKEIKWLFISSLGCAFLWTTWIGAFIMVSTPYKDTVIVLELLSCASVLLGFIFGPKIYIMLSYEPVIVEMHPQCILKDLVSENALFEKEESKRTGLPWSSTELYRSYTHSTCSVVDCKNSPAFKKNIDIDGDQVPIFRTVMRKKNLLRRSQSADRQNFGRIVHQSSLPSKIVISDGKRENRN